ncbi:peptide chain release factor N(5)-glutamine methyltransferase [Angustibacter luteus]|uniref:Release factor glutamine methyltransferase n=1 Tax=Angustibacter luteus TaxID=658456 RepID=A0ABW1JIC9_9ACTN
MSPTSLADQLRAATARLTVAGVPSARHDAEVLAGHVLGLSRADVAVAALRGDDVRLDERFDDLVDERARRVPLQHLTGTAPFRDLELAVGPGVFVPRPETESVAQPAIDEARALVGAGRRPVVVDLCTGSGAIALAVATEVPGAQVHAVELSEQAVAWAAVNVARLAPAVDLRTGDASSAFDDLDGAVDVVVSNPPYIPPDQVPVDPEVRDHDPEVALYGLGADGLQVPRAVVVAAARLLRPGGLLVVEHADVQQVALLRTLTSSGLWREAAGHPDLTGTPRLVSARRA